MRILIRFNYTAVELGSGVVASNFKAACGCSVAVLLANAERIRIPFAGFKQGGMDAFSKMQYVKVLDVLSFSDSSELFSGDTVSIPLTHYCVGVYEDNKVWLLVDDGKLITRRLDTPKKRKADNVVDLNQYRRTL